MRRSGRILRAAVTQRLERDAHGAPVDVLEHSYLEYFSDFFRTITVLSNHPSALPGDVDYDVLIVSGGGDLPNHVWQCPNLSEFDDVLARQRMQAQAGHIRAALERGCGVLGICYGMQLLNTLLGGRVTWQVHGDAGQRQPGAVHDIEVIAPNRLGLNSGIARVNSYHNHGVRACQLHADLDPLARDVHFNVIEAAVHRHRPLLCMTWHPERPSPDPRFNQRLIAAFLETCR